MHDYPDDLILVAEAARRLGVHVNAIHRCISDGKIRGWKKIGRRAVSAADLGLLVTPIPARGERAAGPRPRPRAAVKARLRARGHKV